MSVGKKNDGVNCDKSVRGWEGDVKMSWISRDYNVVFMLGIKKQCAQHNSKQFGGSIASGCLLSGTMVKEASTNNVSYFSTCGFCSKHRHEETMPGKII